MARRILRLVGLSAVIRDGLDADHPENEVLLGMRYPLQYIGNFSRSIQGLTRIGASDYESGGWEFESLRARQAFQDLTWRPVIGLNVMPICLTLLGWHIGRDAERRPGSARPPSKPEAASWSARHGEMRARGCERNRTHDPVWRYVARSPSSRTRYRHAAKDSA